MLDFGTQLRYTCSIKVALYARVSTSDQNCDLQLSDLRQFSARMGWEVAEEYVDQGYSGAKASRPALDRLIADAKQRKFDVVAVWKIDRFGRSVLNLSQQLQTLEAYGIRFVATSQALDTDKSNPTSRLLLHILSSVAEFEREIIRERTVAGIAMARNRGKALGRPRRIFRRDEALRMREAGLSFRQIGIELGVATMTVVRAIREGEAVGRTEKGMSARPKKRLNNRV